MDTSISSHGTWVTSRSVQRFAVRDTCTLTQAAQKLEGERVKTIFAIDADGACIGSFSRGDLIRMVARSAPLDKPPKWNTQFERLLVGQDYLKLEPLLNRKLGNVIPILDSRGRITAALERTITPDLRIGDRVFEPHKRVCVIAEIGNNHNGDASLARRLIDDAAAAGADAVKFQARDMDALYIETGDTFLRQTDYATAYTVRQLMRFNLPFEVLGQLMDHAREQGLLAICSAFDASSLSWLLDYSPDAIKIASCDFTNTAFRPYLARCDRPLLSSTGMNTLGNIETVAEWHRRNYTECTFLHTNSTYPTPVEDVNLGFMKTLRELSPSGVAGYSGHERGIHVPLMAASLGAVVIEKHLTRDRSMEGNDHKVSLLPAELKQLCDQLRDLSVVMGDSEHATRQPSQGEIINSIALEKGVYLTSDADAGQAIAPEQIVIRSPRVGITPLDFEALRDSPLTRSKRAGEALVHADYETGGTGNRSYRLGQYGLPARLRDCRELQTRFEPEFLEYHLFATDLEIPRKSLGKRLKGLNLNFHAPEQFDDGFVLDLVSEDADLRKRSESELERCVRWCLDAAEASGQAREPALIVNCGGATFDADRRHTFDRKAAFETVAGVVEHYRNAGIRLLPQTMPPFPWHFGGQGYHRLFVDLGDLVDIQAIAKIDFCVDLSHSYLACAELDHDFYAKLEQVAPHCAYAHVSDSTYPNGEGLQIGDGVTDFRRVDHILNLSRGPIQWIPEIWNGHLNDFAGFQTALDTLDGLLNDET